MTVSTSSPASTVGSNHPFARWRSAGVPPTLRLDRWEGDAMKFWLRACPKCSGDLELQLDITGAYVQCVQCGLELNPRQERLLRQLGRMPAGPPEAVAPVADGTLHHQVA